MFPVSAPSSAVFLGDWPPRHAPTESAYCALPHLMQNIVDSPDGPNAQITLAHLPSSDDAFRMELVYCKQQRTSRIVRGVRGSTDTDARRRRQMTTQARARV